MHIIDTPGTGSITDVFKHAVLIKSGLTMLPINTVFLVVEYHGRTTTMVKDYEEIITPLKMKNYHEKVVVIVTKFDYCRQQDRPRRTEEIRNYFADENKMTPPCDRIIFSADYTPPE